jgi:hypothetical protein
VAEIEEKKLNLRIKFTLLERTVTEAINLINWGLNFLNQSNFANYNQFYTLYFLNTSLGFELLMKSMLCYKNYENKGNFQVNLKDDYSHKLIKLKNKILENYHGLPSGKAYRDISSESKKEMISKLKKDRNFLSKDKDFKKILKILANYGLGGRYCKLDFITLNNCNQMDPELEINRLIIDILDKKDKDLRDRFVKSINEDENLSNSTEVWREVIRKYINPKLNYFLEALARQFTYGFLGDKARKCHGMNIIAYP